MMKVDEELGLYEENTKCYCGHTTYCDCGPEEPKQKTTIEEAALKIAQMLGTKDSFEYVKMSFELGAKWQQERLCNSQAIQRIRASKSDAEARRIIRTI